VSVLLFIKARQKLALIQIKNAFFMIRAKYLILHILTFFFMSKQFLKNLRTLTTPH